MMKVENFFYYSPNFYEVMCDFQYDQLGEENKK